MKLAIKDEINVQTLARNSIAAIVFDNMDKKLCKVIQHNTLPVLLFRNVLAVVSGDTSDSTSLKDVVADMDKDFLLLNSPKNKKEKEGFMVVLYTVLSDICSPSRTSSGQRTSSPSPASTPSRRLLLSRRRGTSTPPLTSPG